MIVASATRQTISHLRLPFIEIPPGHLQPGNVYFILVFHDAFCYGRSVVSITGASVPSNRLSLNVVIGSPTVSATRIGLLLTK